MDETWSACRFKNKPKNSIRAITTKSDKALYLPERLQILLNENLASKKFFESLSYTNRKEYALWISSAKRADTIEKRLSEVIVKLRSGKKNPSEM
ncbi:MAG: YdeI/OmpD-associated family protein [Cyclobacteriaceae bacterium]